MNAVPLSRARCVYGLQAPPASPGSRPFCARARCRRRGSSCARSAASAGKHPNASTHAHTHTHTHTSRDVCSWMQRDATQRLALSWWERVVHYVPYPAYGIYNSVCGITTVACCPFHVKLYVFHLSLLSCVQGAVRVRWEAAYPRDRSRVPQLRLLRARIRR